MRHTESSKWFLSRDWNHPRFSVKAVSHFAIYIHAEVRVEGIITTTNGPSVFCRGPRMQFGLFVSVGVKKESRLSRIGYWNMYEYVPKKRFVKSKSFHLGKRFRRDSRIPIILRLGQGSCLMASDHQAECRVPSRIAPSTLDARQRPHEFQNICRSPVIRCDSCSWMYACFLRSINQWSDLTYLFKCERMSGENMGLGLQKQK